MKKIFHYILIIFIFGCTKAKIISPISIQYFRGNVIDYTTGLPIANANIQLIRANEPYPIFNISELDDPIYDFTICDTSGNFQFSVPVNIQKLVYKIVPSKSGFVFADTSIATAKLINFSITNLYDTVFLDRPSILQINFHDTTFSSINDTLKLSESFGASTIINPYWRPHIYEIPISYNSTIQLYDSVSFKLNNYARIFYEVHHIGLMAQPVDTTVSLIQFGTKVVDLFY